MHIRMDTCQRNSKTLKENNKSRTQPMKTLQKLCFLLNRIFSDTKSKGTL